MAKKILTSFMEENGVKTYQTEMPPIPIKKFRAWCKHFGTPPNIYYLKRGVLKPGMSKYIVPGVYIMSMLRQTVEKLHKEDPTFPISIANHIKEPSYTSLEESQDSVLVGDKLILKARTWAANKVGNNIIVGVQVEVWKKQSVVFKATFEFIQYG